MAADVRGFVEGLGRELALPVLVVGLAAPVVVAAIFFVWTRVATVRLGYQISRAGAEHRRLVEEKSSLRSEISSLRSPRRLEALAQEKFGLTPPRPEQIVFVRTVGENR